MVSASAALGFAYLYLCLAFAALELSTFLDSQCGAGTGTTTCAEAPLFHSAAEVLPPLAAVVVLFVAVALTYRHLSHRHAYAVPVAGAGNGRRSISGSGLVMFVLCVPTGTLEFIVFGGQAAGGAADHGALGLAALGALPAAATATFFLGMMLIIVAHVRAGGEGGGGAVAADGLIQGFLRLLTKVAAGAAAALVGLMAMAVTLYGAKLRLAAEIESPERGVDAGYASSKLQITSIWYLRQQSRPKPVSYILSISSPPKDDI